MFLRKFFIVSKIIVCGHAVKFVVTPVIIKIFFNPSSKLFFQNSIEIKFLEDSKEST